jgi:transcription initiation factor TFIIE subunit alpha
MKSVLEVIEILLGGELVDEAKSVITLLEKEKTLNETDISEKLEIGINVVRKILYPLSELDIVYYTKEKHPEKKWWYVYSWTFDVSRVYKKYIEFLKKQLKEKEDHLADETVRFECRKCERKIEHEDALSCDFICSHCGKMLKETKPKKDAKLGREIKKLRKEIEEYS